MLNKVAQSGIVWPFVMFYSRIIEVVRPFDGGVPSDVPTILAINPDRFIDDLTVISNSKRFRVLKLPFKWQKLLLAIFWTSNVTELIRSTNYYNPEDNEYLIKVQKQLRGFLRKFLLSLYSRLNVDCVIGAAVHYIQDYDWGLVSDEIGVPYIVLHKENIYSPRALELLQSMYKRAGRFKGSHIIVHNKMMKDFFVRNGFCNTDNISALGCLRMDAFVKRVKLSSQNIRKKKADYYRKKVTLFSFTYGYRQRGLSAFKGMPDFPKHRDKGFVKIFEKVHTSIAKLALQNENVDFVIKPKWGGIWIDEIEYVLSKNNIESKNIDNLFIDSNVNVYDLIAGSDVICGFTSTAILEAAIAAKHVVVPYFEEALKVEYNELLDFKDYFHLFDIAHSADEFERLIIEGLEKPTRVDMDLLQERYALFEKYVSSMNGDALEKYTKVINGVIDASKKPFNIMSI